MGTLYSGRLLVVTGLLITRLARMPVGFQEAILMSDLVERLRVWHLDATARGLFVGQNAAALCRAYDRIVLIKDAADEIERLNDLCGLREEAKGKCPLADRLRGEPTVDDLTEAAAEIERLHTKPESDGEK